MQLVRRIFSLVMVICIPLFLVMAYGVLKPSSHDAFMGQFALG